MSGRISDAVRPERLWQRHEALARIGATQQGGVDRPALSAHDVAACRQLLQWGTAFGMQASRDAAGNVFLRLQGSDAAASPVLSGSHLDSQPTGGRYDGVYGVLAALEVCQAMVEAGFQPRRSIDVVAWMNEEGSRFAPGMMGSAVFAGERSLADIAGVCDVQGISVGAALQQAGQALADVPPRPLGGPVFAYVEAHIEQGPCLQAWGKPIGVVSGIQGKRTFRVCVRGEAAHAGTCPQADRRDALLAAVAMVQALSAHMHDPRDLVRFTVGRFSVVPNAPSVVASGVEFSIDLRHPDSQQLRSLGDAVAGLCQRHKGPCDVQVQELSCAMSLEFPGELRQRIAAAADRLGLAHAALHSAAGHDARYLHSICPTAMLFIPCHLGITHNEAESITPAHAEAGARVLTEVLAELAQLQSCGDGKRRAP